MRQGKIPDYDNPDQVCTGLVVFNDEKCIRCNACTYPCPCGAIKIPQETEGKKRGLPFIEKLATGIIPCIACGDCMAACPKGAISIQQGFRVSHPYFYERLTQDKKLTCPQKY
jgi:formate hydrogenlyase subunit 6/NADH:ubiquinone oxidoreductase subunit I